MADFNSFEELYSKLQPTIGEILRDEAEKIKGIIQDYVITVIYSSYSPYIYNRTLELLNSIIIDYKIVDNEYIAEIKIDTNMMQSPSNSYNQELLPITDIAQMFADGYGYERGGENMDMIGDTYENYIATGDAIKDILNMLKSKGFDIV